LRLQRKRNIKGEKGLERGERRAVIVVLAEVMESVLIIVKQNNITSVCNVMKRNSVN
jgi:hypothetical protein